MRVRAIVAHGLSGHQRSGYPLSLCGLRAEGEVARKSLPRRGLSGDEWCSPSGLHRACRQQVHQKDCGPSLGCHRLIKADVCSVGDGVMRNTV